MSDPEPLPAPEWRCPQQACTKPLSAHLVTQADMYLKQNQPKVEKR